MRRVVAAGVAAGALLAVVVAVVGGPAEDRRPPVRPFLAAWERSLMGTFVVEQVVERRLVSGRSFSSEVRLVQRPPDRIRESSSGTEGQVGGRRFGCVPDAGCRIGGGARPYRAVVEEELALLRALVTGPTAAYSVRHGGRDGCYLLVLRARILAPPYGEDAMFCFDVVTGAPVSTLVHRAEATDLTRTVGIRREVRDEDLAPPAGVAG